MDYVETWVDDISIDTEHKNPTHAASAIVRVYRDLSQALEEDGHKVSVPKTFFEGFFPAGLAPHCMAGAEDDRGGVCFNPLDPRQHPAVQALWRLRAPSACFWPSAGRPGVRASLKGSTSPFPAALRKARCLTSRTFRAKPEPKLGSVRGLAPPRKTLTKPPTPKATSPRTPLPKTRRPLRGEARDAAVAATPAADKESNSTERSQRRLRCSNPQLSLLSPRHPWKWTTKQPKKVPREEAPKWEIP